MVWVAEWFSLCWNGYCWGRIIFCHSGWYGAMFWIEGKNNICWVVLLPSEESFSFSCWPANEKAAQGDGTRTAGPDWLQRYSILCNSCCTMKVGGVHWEGEAATAWSPIGLQLAGSEQLCWSHLCHFILSFYYWAVSWLRECEQYVALMNTVIQLIN